MRTILAYGCWCGLATVALACVNDSELPRRELEFRERYQPYEPNAPDAPGGSAEPIVRQLALRTDAVTGLALAAGVAAVAFAATRRPA